MATRVASPETEAIIPGGNHGHPSRPPSCGAAGQHAARLSRAARQGSHGTGKPAREVHKPPAHPIKWADTQKKKGLLFDVNVSEVTGYPLKFEVRFDSF